LKQQLNNAATVSVDTVSVAEWSIASVLGLGLAIGVWWGLATGAGLLGGDTYTYFMPQKQLMAESFQRGELPLWHDRTGLGYPLLAESQAGVLYPTNQILYRLLDINSAYNVSLMLHYWLAFVFAWRFARCQQLTMWSAALAALIYVYGWFPARVSLEWSIIGGMWLPLTLWLTDSLLRNPSRRTFAVLVLCLGCHLLAGHFTLAFINQLALVGYAGLWWWLNRADSASGISIRRVVVIPAAIFCSLLLASVQLLPTLELKQTSQREAGANRAFKPAYGHMPPLYVTQLAASWTYWHTPEIVQARSMMRLPLTIDADSNAVEAHLYLGLIPLGLVCLSVFPQMRLPGSRSVYVTWIVLSVSSLIYATGWLIPMTSHLPGFGFFIGPGRYTILCSLGGAIIAGMVLDQLLQRRQNAIRFLVTASIAAITMTDVLAASRYVTNGYVVPEPPLTKLDQSWIRRTLTDAGPHDVRLLAPGPNVSNLYGVSCLPTYLGLGPSVYFSDDFQIPGPQEFPDEVYPSDDLADRMRHLGITHLLTEQPIPQPSPVLKRIGAAPDAMLNPLWARGVSACYLYRFHQPAERVVAVPADAMLSWKWISHTPGNVEFDLELSAPADVELRELMYPGWKVEVDGVPVDTDADGRINRTVQVAEGTHHVRWLYAPLGFQIGSWISLLTLCLVGLCLLPVRRTAKTESQTDTPSNTPT
jgi:hypothetical protein